MRRPVDVKAHFRFLLSVSLFPFSQAAPVAILRCGTALYHAAVRTAMSPGIECIGSLLAGCILFASIILILCAAWALLPKVRAGCGKSARPDPRRGSWATVIPTPTLPSLWSLSNQSLLGSRSRHCYGITCQEEMPDFTFGGQGSCKGVRRPRRRDAETFSDA